MTFFSYLVPNDKIQDNKSIKVESKRKQKLEFFSFSFVLSAFYWTNWIWRWVGGVGMKNENLFFSRIKCRSIYAKTIALPGKSLPITAPTAVTIFSSKMDKFDRSSLHAFRIRKKTELNHCKFYETAGNRLSSAHIPFCSFDCFLFSCLFLLSFRLFFPLTKKIFVYFSYLCKFVCMCMCARSKYRTFSFLYECSVYLWNFFLKESSNIALKRIFLS